MCSQALLPYLRANIGIGDFLVQAIQGFAYMCLLSSRMRKAVNRNQPSPFFCMRLYLLEGEPTHRLVASDFRSGRPATLRAVPSHTRGKLHIHITHSHLQVVGTMQHPVSPGGALKVTVAMVYAKCGPCSPV